MSSPTLRVRRHGIALSLSILGLFLLIANWPIEAKSARRRPVNDSRAETEFEKPASQDEVGPAKLNYNKAPWSRVLKDLAKATDSTLVMHKVPWGRFTRRDKARYSRGRAVAILNSELKKQGFRLVEKGKYLDVLDLHTVRTRYTRPPAPVETRPSETQKTTRQPSKFRKYERKFDTITPRGSAGRRDVSGRFYSDRQPLGRKPATRADRQPLQLVGHAEEQTETVVRTMHRAADLARTIYQAVKPRAELIQEGPNGLPAFRVYRQQAPPSNSEPGRLAPAVVQPAVQFTIGIDTERDQLRVVAGQTHAKELKDLIRFLDRSQREPNQTTRLVGTARDATLLANRLRPTLNRLVAQRTRNNNLQQPPRRQDTVRRTLQGTQPNQPRPGDDQPAVAPQPQQGEPVLEIPGLRGPVTILDVPGIGLVIRGNKDDVDAVIRIIRELDKFGVGAVPKLRLLLLRHVNSEALAELLTTVYEQLGTIRAGESQRQPQQTVAVIAVVKPNAVLILAPEGEMEAIIGHVDQLDQPIDPHSEARVFPLKSAIATSVVTMLESFYEDREGLGTRVVAVAEVRTNSVIVHAQPADMMEIATLIRKLDRDQVGAVSQLRVFVLKNAVAEDLADVINTSIQAVLSPPGTTGQFGGAQAAAGGQSAQELREAKSVALEFLTTDGKAQRIVRSGILADIRINAEARTNSLIVTAPEQSMELIAALIKHLDQPTETVAEIKVFSLANSDATAAAELLETLFQDQNQQDQLGVALVGAEDASSSLIPMRFSVDVRTNSILAIGGAEALAVVEAILLRLDESDLRQRQNTVIHLNNSPAEEVANAINAFLDSQRNLANINPDLVSNIELLEREIIVVPETVTNNIIISATPRYYDEILELVAKLDQAPAQVIIQALLVEVELQNTDEFGIELGIQDSILFKRSLLNLENFQTITSSLSDPSTGIVTTTETIVNSEGIPGFLFNNQTLGNNTAVGPGSLVGQGLSSFSLGRTNSDLGFGGLVLSASSESISVLIRALSSQRHVHILSRPQIRTVDNLPAIIHVGQQVPIISGFTPANANFPATPLTELVDVGIVLNVIPRISPDGMIVMETIATKSSIAPNGVPLFTDPGTGIVFEQPIIDIAEAQATIAVRDGQTIVMGGMITRSEDTLERKVPWLGDLPLIGRAFRFDGTTTRRTELLIFLTPRLIKNDSDSETIKQVEIERMHFFQEEAEEMHGPLLALPPEADGMAPKQPADGRLQAPPAPDETTAPKPIIPNTFIPPAPPSNGDGTAGIQTYEPTGVSEPSIYVQTNLETEMKPVSKKRKRFSLRSIFKPSSN